MHTHLNPYPINAEGRPDPVSPLNYRQEKFCAHYSLSGNAAEAARQAGYSERSACNQGSRLTRDMRVRARVYELRVNRAIQFGPVMAFTRLENLYEKAVEAGRYRTAATILILQARLSGLESWTPRPAAASDPRVEEPGSSRRIHRGRGVFGLKGRPDPFDNLSELAATDTDEQ